MWFPDAGYLLALHERIIDAAPEDVARVHGVLTPGAIGSAIERAKWGPFRTGDVAERAAFLLRGIALDHPFADGNKRTAFEAASVFMERNGASRHPRTRWSLSCSLLPRASLGWSRSPAGSAGMPKTQIAHRTGDLA